MEFKLIDQRLVSMKTKHILPVLLAAFTLLGACTGLAATVTTAGSGNWNSTTPNAPWPGGTMPASTDNVVIRAGDNVTNTVDATINSITFSNNATTTATLTVLAGVTNTVTAGVTNQNSATVATAVTIQGGGTINCASLTVGGTTTPTGGTDTTTLTSTISTLSISGNLTVRGFDSGLNDNNGTFSLNSGSVSVGGLVVLNADSGASATLTMAGGAQTGTLTLSGSSPFSTPGAGTATFTATGTGATVIYSNPAPTIRATTYQNLEFNGTGTAGADGALTIQGNLSNTGGGTLDFGANNVTLSGTATANSIAGFTTTGTVSMTKTAGTATFTGDVNGGALTINGTGSTLNLGAGLTHTFTGTWTRTAGTLNGGFSTLKIAGTTSGTGGTFTAGTSTVEWNGAGAQTIAGVTYSNLVVSGSDRVHFFVPVHELVLRQG
jgi:hypothetical protein